MHSRIRNALFGEMPARFTGLLAWRGLVPMERLPERLRRLVGTNWVGPGGHVVHYPVRSGTLLNFVGTAERSDWQVESWTERGTTEEALNDFKGWNADVETIIRNIERAVQMGAARTRTAGAMDQRPRHAARRRRASDAADDGAGRQHGDRGWRGAGAKPCGARRRRRGAARPTKTRAATEPAAWYAPPTTMPHASTIPRSAMSEGAARYVDSEWQEAKVKQRYDWVFEYDPVRIAI